MRAVRDDIARRTLSIYSTDARLRLELDAEEMRWLSVNAIRQTLLNLVQNALDYGQAPVIVPTSVMTSEIQIQVLDSGKGLSAAEWYEAVRPFHRLREQPGSDHTGLGLALAERLVGICGGHLDAKQVAGGIAVTAMFPAQRNGC